MIPVDAICADIDCLFSECDRLDNTSVAFHSRLQFLLKRLAKKYGFAGVAEYSIPDCGGGRGGRIDVAWLTRGVPAVLIEIDSSRRQKSIDKLKCTPADLKVWIYYGRFEIALRDADDIVLVAKRARCG